MRFKSARGLLRPSNHHNKWWGCQSVLGFVWCYFHMDLLCVSAVSFYVITLQHYGNPNISPRLQCQTSYTISDKNNGLLQSESQVSENWINMRQQCFLSKEDDQGGTALGSKDFQSGFNGKMLSQFSLCTPPLLSQRDYRENVDPDHLMVYVTKKTFPDSCSLRPPWWSL